MMQVMGPENETSCSGDGSDRPHLNGVRWRPYCMLLVASAAGAKKTKSVYCPKEGVLSNATKAVRIAQYTAPYGAQCECGLRGSGPSRMSDSLTTFVVVLTAYTVELCQAVRVRECVPPRAYGRSMVGLKASVQNNTHDMTPAVGGLLYHIIREGCRPRPI